LRPEIETIGQLQKLPYSTMVYRTLLSRRKTMRQFPVINHSGTNKLTAVSIHSH